MSKARKVKKAALGVPAHRRCDRLFDKREARDPFYLIGQVRFSAPVKYSRCKVCVGRPHHSPWLLDGRW